MITIYLNPRCSKSREGLDIIKNSGKEFKIREYLKEPLNEFEVGSLLSKLNLSPVEIIRTNENIWKENFKDLDLRNGELIKILAKNPKLIERPIVEKENSTVIGRPLTKLENFL